MDLDGHCYLQLNYNVQRYRIEHNKIQIWNDEGLYRFKIELDLFNHPIKLEYVNGVSLINFSPVK